MTKAPLVGQTFVYGDSLHSMLVAVVTPDPDQLKAWAARAGRAGEPADAVARSPEFNKAVLEEMAAAAAAAKLQSFEKVRAVHVAPTPWTPDDLLTATFKLKRVDAKKAYEEVIDEMYVKLGDLVAGVNAKQK